MRPMTNLLLLRQTLIPATKTPKPPLPPTQSKPFTSATATTTSATPDSETPSENHSSVIIHPNNFLQRSSQTLTGLQILDLIDAGSLQPTTGIYSLLLRKCTLSKKLEEGKLVHSHFLNSKFNQDIFFQNSIIHFYSRCNSLQDARNVFDEMTVRDVVSWTALMSGYTQNDRPKDALALFPGMLCSDCRPNQFTFATLLNACAATEEVKTGVQIHGFCVKNGCDLDVYVGSSLLDMYAHHGKMSDASAVFDCLDSKNEVSWNALIAGYARKQDQDRAIAVFAEMRRCGFFATRFTYSSLFSVCASNGSLEQGIWVHAHMIKFGHSLNNFVGNTLMDMYAKAGSIHDARKVFNRLNKSDVVSWNSMLTGFAQHGLGRDAVRCFNKMREHGVKPNHITFLCILNACSHGGLFNKWEHYFNLMKTYKLEPEIEHYVTVVDMLGRSGQLERAHNFIIEMPLEPTAAVWGALLGACRMHKDAELGQFAAERVFELDPHDTGPHLLLYNIYASANRWQEAAKVRKVMRETGLKKEPACSWVEIENSVHVFVANENTHPDIKEIEQMWEKISERIKEEGYVPDTNYVLMHVDEQEREAKLRYHSEKLALAFALLRLPSGVLIRIKKNIRICGDCHSAIKLVSKVVKREIIIRDTNRFHHFSAGSCSCGDYW